MNIRFQRGFEYGKIVWGTIGISNVKRSVKSIIPSWLTLFCRHLTMNIGQSLSTFDVIIETRNRLQRFCRFV